MFQRNGTWDRHAAGWAGVVVVFFAAMGQAAIVFHDQTAESGIAFVHSDGGCEKKYIMENVSAGLALFDYDNDGLVDIYFLTGTPLKDCKYNKPLRNALYHNEGNWRFTDVTEKSGLGDGGYGLGVAVGDYDNDGFLDIFLNNYGPKKLFHNNGDGTFTDVTEKAGLGGDLKMGAGACFFDMDKDGFLDLYVAHYVQFSYDKHFIHTMRGVPIYMGPPYYPGEEHSLYHNNGDGTFTDVSRESGIAGHIGNGMGMVCCDYDNDGDTDIFVANDMGGNFLWDNDGKGHFTEKGLLSGFAYDLNGEEHGSMGVDCGDYDNDGRIDFYVTSYQGQFATLYRNTGGGILEDVTLVTGEGEGTFTPVTWGNSIVDLDNDGFRDIFVACGHLQTNIELWNDVGTYKNTNVVLQNMGNGKFVNVSDKAGDGLAVKESSRGAGFDDLDNDGKVDIVIVNSRTKPTILRNESTGQGNWLQVELRGKTNKFGVGSQARVYAGDLMLVDEVHAGRGYQSSYGMRLYFGLGKRDTIDRVEVRWMGGKTEAFRIGKVNQRITLTEGSGEILKN
jgi:enediyne biosynthesis protein E4